MKAKYKIVIYPTAHVERIDGKPLSKALLEAIRHQQERQLRLSMVRRVGKDHDGQ